MITAREIPGAIVSTAMDDPSVFCDNHSTCMGLYLGRGNLIKTREAARARGWAFYEGFNLDNTRQMSVSLCPACAQTERRKLPKAWAPLEGQEGLFDGGSGSHAAEPGGGAVSACRGNPWTT